MNVNYRTSDFKIEQIHGKIPYRSSPEARIRNYVFGARSLLINHTKDRKTNIRTIGYEVPIYARGKKRDECIDLLGYDQIFHPWIIELKIGKSSESLNDVVSQVDRYARAFEEGIREHVQEEFRERLLWPSFSFNGAVKRMILADRTFYAERTNRPENSDHIIFCSFSRYTDEKTLLKSPRPVINLRIEKRLTSESNGTSLSVGP